MVDGLPLPQTPAQLLIALILAYVGGGIGVSLTAAVAIYKAYQERGKPEAEIHVSNTQGELNLAQAAQATATGNAVLMGVAIEMAKASHAELIVKRAEVAEKERELSKCRDQVKILEDQLLRK